METRLRFLRSHFYFKLRPTVFIAKPRDPVFLANYAYPNLPRMRTIRIRIAKISMLIFPDFFPHFYSILQLSLDNCVICIISWRKSIAQLLTFYPIINLYRWTNFLWEWEKLVELNFSTRANEKGNDSWLDNKYI